MAVVVLNLGETASIKRFNAKPLLSTQMNGIYLVTPSKIGFMMPNRQIFPLACPLRAIRRRPRDERCQDLHTHPSNFILNRSIVVEATSIFELRYDSPVQMALSLDDHCSSGRAATVPLAPHRPNVATPNTSRCADLRSLHAQRHRLATGPACSKLGSLRQQASRLLWRRWMTSQPAYSLQFGTSSGNACRNRVDNPASSTNLQPKYHRHAVTTASIAGTPPPAPCRRCN